MRIARFLLAGTLLPVIGAQEPSPVRDWIAGHAIRLTTPEAGHGFDDMQPLKQVVGKARIVALGEATHGTHEFFQLKHRMVEFLASQMGFTIFAIEANMPEAYQLNEYVLHGTGDPVALIKGMYFWTWDTQEVLAMVKWMREFNASGKGQIQFTGFDMQTPTVAAKIAGDFIAAHDPDYSPTVQKASRLALAPSAQPGRFASATGSFPVSAAAGKRIHFSGYIKTNDADDGYAGLWWRADGPAQNQPLAFDNMQGRGAKGTTDWKKFDLELPIPAETRNINFGALLVGKGTAWFDGLAVEVDGVPYANDSVFGFLKYNTQQGPYQLRVDSQTQREGHATLMIRRTGQPANAVDPKEGSAAWHDIVAHMEASREKYGANRDTEWAIQNARVVEQCMQGRAGQVYRDASMATNIKWILDQNPGAKIVLWAHNGHVNFGGDQGQYKPMGQWLREWYGDQMAVFGFAFNQGSFQAIEQGKGLHDFTIVPAPTGGFDAMLASAGIPLFALDLRQLPKTGPAADWFNQAHSARTIGAVYSESAGTNYFRPLVAPQTFNVILYVDKTTAARKNDALPPPPPAAEYRDETYPVTMKLTPEVQVQNVQRWGDQETTVAFRTVPGFAALYFRVLHVPRALSADQVSKVLDAAIEAKVKQRLDEGNEGYHIRESACTERTIGERPARSCIADFKNQGEDYSEYLTYVLSEKTTALFFARCVPRDFDGMRARLEKVIETVRIP
jgi:erythromycin esterase-like protein